MNDEPALRILFATEYLPPYVSGIANRCKNLINGYRKQGHKVTVFSVAGSDCDFEVTSIPNPFYKAQKSFILPPLGLLIELLDFSKPVNYDIAHLVAPLCLSFLPILPLMWLRGIRIYVSYHVYLDYYRDFYIGKGDTIISWIFISIINILFRIIYYIPLTLWSDCVGIPSKTADKYVFDYSPRIHIIKSGLDTDVFHPKAALSLNLNNNNEGDDVESLKIIKTSFGYNDTEFTNIRKIAGEDSKNGPVLIYCGRLAAEKNIDFLINAMIDPLMKEATLVIVGDGPLRINLEELAVKAVGKKSVFSANQDKKIQSNPSQFLKGERNRIIFLGMILNEHKVASLYAQSDIFVSASASETFGFTVAEAMACGTPSVVVRSGAFPDVYNMINDWMFEIDDVLDFAKICGKVFQDIKDSKIRARKIALENFSIESSVKDLISTYRWVLRGCIE